MKAITCTSTRRLLLAFHDRELSVGDQIAVAAHLDWCDDCAAILADVRSVGSALRVAARQRVGLSNEEAASFGTVVVNRLKAEQDASFQARISGMFDDMHLVYAGVCATVASAVCVVLLMGMMRFAAEARPDSLAGILTVMAAPLGCETPSDSPDEASCFAGWLERFQRANRTAEQDAVFTLDATVIREGRLTNLAVLRASSHRAASAQALTIEGLLDAVSRARSETQPDARSGNMLRVVARTTVRATRPAPINLPLPPVLKPAASTLGASPATA